MENDDGRKKVKNTYKKLGERIAFYRKKRSLTQEQLADLCTISKSFLGKIEAPNIEVSFSIVVLERIAEKLGIPIKDLFSPINENLIRDED